MTSHIPILMYHQIEAPPPRGTPMRGLVVAPRAFAWQMRMLRLLGFQGLALRDLLPYLRGERAGRVVGITLDDGYRNNLQHALPVLLRCNFTATCYAVSSLAGHTNRWDAEIGVPEKPLMTVAELREWSRAGMEVGAHTRTHVDLTSVNSVVARDQIEGSRHDLEAALGVQVRHFCYPFGRFDNVTADLVREAGFHTAVTTNRGRAVAGRNLFELPRVPVSRSTHPGQFLQKLVTAYEDRRGMESKDHDSC
ncbi:polysaccharide deacetylase family protein [Cupriavidus sp. D39]|uniref:polysaccharide deacetylase family protein n=1 Tax=Cupriavidus sp. D39 TaxID=2997877 RepID=UPI00226E88FF|nr:polysaccharide deacetylase family protein [Cupriavidus sp. D39]MCY0856377.1 polysaccharide deacetylase family protein [Cupriavidus sp. D39]